MSIWSLGAADVAAGSIAASKIKRAYYRARRKSDPFLFSSRHEQDRVVGVLFMT